MTASMIQMPFRMRCGHVYGTSPPQLVSPAASCAFVAMIGTSPRSPTDRANIGPAPADDADSEAFHLDGKR
jgi:hypothetical protein